MSDAEYWKARCKLAESEIERLQTVKTKLPVRANSGDLGNDVSAFDRFEEELLQTAREQEAIQMLMAIREDGCEDVKAVAARLIADSDERKRALNSARRAGYPVDDHPDVSWLFERLLADLSSGRSTIDFLSRPPKLPVEVLPVGAVFTTSDGRLLEVKRERADGETLVTAYRWDRNVEPCTIDRKQLVQPIGRVVFESTRKQIVLGLLELSQHALAQVVTEGPKQLGNG